MASNDLTLKVMRLVKPPFAGETPNFLEGTELVAVSQSADSKLLSNSLIPVLTVPQPNNTFLMGETFSSYITLLNSSNFEFTQLNITAEMQSQSQRVILLDKAASNGTLKPGSSLDFVISHELKEEGNHNLMCVVSYSRPEGEQRHIRRFFKVIVENPFVFTNSVTQIGDATLLEVQLKNVAKNPIYLGSVNFVAQPFYTVTDLNHPVFETTSGVSQMLAQIVYIKPQQARRYLFRLTSRTDLDSRIARNMTPGLGYLDVQWKTHLGAESKMRSPMLDRKQQVRPEIVQCKVISVPSEIRLETPFEIVCLITNSSEARIQLRFTVAEERMTGLLFQGISGQVLPALNPHQDFQLPLTLFPTRSGIQTISGLVLSDISSDRAFSYDFLTDVLVE